MAYMQQPQQGMPGIGVGPQQAYGGGGPVGQGPPQGYPQQQQQPYPGMMQQGPQMGGPGGMHMGPGQGQPQPGPVPMMGHSGGMPPMPNAGLQQQQEQMGPAFSVDDVEDKDGVRLSWNVW